MSRMFQQEELYNIHIKSYVNIKKITFIFKILFLVKSINNQIYYKILILNVIVVIVEKSKEINTKDYDKSDEVTYKLSKMLSMSRVSQVKENQLMVKYLLQPCHISYDHANNLLQIV